MRRLLSAALLLTLLCTGCGAAPARPAAEPPVLAGTFANDAAATDGDTIAFFLPEGESAPAPSAAPTEGSLVGQVLELLEPAPSEEPGSDPAAETPEAGDGTLDEDGAYTTKEDLALYIRTYGHLPSNFITKKEAEKAGWSGGSLERVLPGMCIGGDRFGNYEGLLPKAKGRQWTECDINTLGAKSRGAERIVFSNDGLIYYTDDHYATFTLLYGED